EVLETYVANFFVDADAAKTHAKESTNDTSNFTTSELTANPQHTNDNAVKDAQDAYTLLQNATFPLNLPFDIHLATAREFFQGQQTTRFHLMRTFGDAMSHATAAERLEISEREFELLTLKKLDGTSDAGIDLTKDLWGNPPLAAGEVLGRGLANVQTFLSTTTINYANLINLLKTRFLNPHFPINVYLQALSTTDRNSWLTDHPTENELALSVIELAGDAEDPCNLSKTRILHLSGQVLSDAELSRFNRFIRLWKKLGCTIAELDGLLTALGAPDIAPEVIGALSGVWHIRETLNLSLEQAAVLVGNIPTAGTGTLFAKLFLNKAILQIDEKFILNVSQTEVDAQTEFLKNHIPAILAALQITEEDLNRIGEYTKLDLSVGTPTSAKLTLANLSMIYRYVLVAKGRRIPLKDVITWFDILKLPPLVKVTDVMTSLDRLEKLQRYGFNAPDFAYVFQNEKPTGTTLPPKDDIINQSAKALQDGLLTLQQENTPTNDIVTAEFLKLKLAIFLEPEEATKIIGILDESNTQDTFSYLRTPQVSAKFKDVFQDYVTAADVTDMAATKEVPERFKKYWSKIEGKLLPVLRKTFIHQHLIATFNADAALIALMLQDPDVLKPCLDMELGSDIHARAYKDLYRMLHKSMWLIGQLQLSTRELAYFQKNTNFADFNWKNFKIAAWLRVADFIALRHTLTPADQDLVVIFQTAKEGGDVAQAIVAVTDWDPVNVKYFVGKRSGSEFVNELPLILLQTQNELSQLIGVSIEHLASWATDIISKDQARDVKHTLKAKYDEDAWVEVSTRIHNTLRTRSRDALVSYLLQKSEMKSLGLRDTNDLYGYFLIDIEMDACMLTSRVKQAIASVQLFVQRVLLNLESFKPVASQRIDPGQIDAKQWKWMKNYRVWEANRKVFLYPENWIEPELRDNKSPFFKELESALLQGEVTDESAEKVLMGYLEKLHNVARLDVCGIYEDTEARELHVVGRTFNTPPQYFYRKLDLKTQVWTPWESVQVDIQGNDQGESAGVHLIPVVWNRRLYLFWPIFTEKSDRKKLREEDAIVKKWNDYKAQAKELGFTDDLIEKQLNLFVDFGTYTRPSPPPSEEKNPWAYYEIRLAWSEYRQGKWSNKKVSQSFLRTASSSSGVGPTYAYRFAVNLGETLKIQMLWQSFLLNLLLPVGEFLLNCNGKVTIKQPKQPPVQIINPKHMNFYESYVSADSFNFDNYLPEIKWRDDTSIPLTLNGVNDDILSGSEKEYQVVFPPDHDFSDNIPSKFMYQDHKRAYYIEAEGSWHDKIIPNLREPGKTWLPQTIYSLRSEPPQAAEKPSRFLLSTDKYHQISEEALNTVVEKNEIGVSAAMQIRSTKNLGVSSTPWMESEGSISSSEKLRFDYFESATRSKMKLQFKPFFHAYVCQFMGALDKDGVDGLLSLDHQQYSDIVIKPPLGNFFGVYTPNKDYVAHPYPTENVDFSQGGAWSIYNWELFFHVPMLLANRLSQNQRFAEARRWYHFIFNPTTNENLASTARYWKVIPFRNTSKETLESLLRQLHSPAGDPKRKELEEAIAAWRANPFNPHLIARMRLIAYQKNVVIKYLDNLIAWADSLFRQDTIESINEATQLYILAAEILGKRPEKIPPRGETRSLNYAELELESEGRGLDAFSNAMVKLETTFPFFNIQEVQPGEGGAAPILNRTTDALYFCLPDNDKLLGYWDTVAERLFKIRHCQNIEGIERQLALFEPAIDPALFVRAIAGGVDINSVLADLNSPVPHYRFSYILQKAVEICAELRSLGNTLLSVLEKKDS
ncbi:MAG: hypothetical protein H0X47_06555, partial [Nitrospirales bacterium]|nr:hypothetical protein [Nitrospirales bacterium]